MDAAEYDFDIKLQKISGDLVADFDRTLQTFLHKPDGHGGRRVRSWVRSRETYRLTSNVLDLFQELPQLLDPHLPKWIPFLADAYLEYLQTRRRNKKASGRSKWLMSVDKAICTILYHFCKIRGEKVIVRFLNVETKYLELLLSAIEEAEQTSADAKPGDATQWSWEQRYVVLLWLSHLMLAPFDLSTISSLDLGDDVVPEISGMKWPENLPAITVRVIPLGIKYLATPGKERDAAKMLLVRTAMRRDMQQLGVLDSLVHWALSAFRPQKDAMPQTPYFYLGVLSFLAGMLRASSDTSDMNKYLSTIFNAVHSISAGGDEPAKTIVSLALARKTIIKVLRSVVVLLLRQDRQSMESTELTETAIGYLLDGLADNDTPVRLAASKALSIIALKLDPEMASQVVEAVLESLNRNVFWNKASNEAEAKPTRDVSQVDSLEWHGLMLTLSHLLYRRSPPAEQLSDIIHALLLGLSFEQRSTTGGSVGGNVRDAACFGIWAIARRYSTQELLAVSTHSVYAAKAYPASVSILQVLGTELVVTGCLDPAGNIRRGASAALQELIGRHPDTVEKGIEVVQTVDYHAVARRSRATEEVALNVTKLFSQYGEAILEGILGWRGIGDVNAPSRRASGSAFGQLTVQLAQSSSIEPETHFKAALKAIMTHVKNLEKRQVEERHGLLLCLAALFDKFPELACATGQNVDKDLIATVLKVVIAMLEDCSESTYRKPELVAEGASRVIVCSLPVFQVAVLNGAIPAEIFRGDQLLCAGRSDIIRKLCVIELQQSGFKKEMDELLTVLEKVLPSWLSRKEEETIDSSSLAGVILLIYSNLDRRMEIITPWAEAVRKRPTGRSAAQSQGYFYTLAMMQPLIDNEQLADVDDTFIPKIVLERWDGDTDVDTRAAILQSLTRSRILRDKPLAFLRALEDGLNDYTTSAQGDIGSHVRLQALKAVKSLWERLDMTDADEWMERSLKTLFYSVLRLSAEKLDRVRPEAQAALALTMQQSSANPFKLLTFSSKAYFDKILQLHGTECFLPKVSDIVKPDTKTWMCQLMAGLVTSADTGNDDLVMASRTTLCDFCETSQVNLDAVCTSLWHNLKTYQGQDRVVVPTLETIAFLFSAGLFQKSTEVGWRGLCLQTQKAGYKTGNMRKLAACVKVYGGVAGLAAGDNGETEGILEARKRLGALMYHPWPRVRSAVVDELWELVGNGLGDVEMQEERGSGADGLLGVDWAKADKAKIKAVVEELKLG